MRRLATSSSPSKTEPQQQVKKREAKAMNRQTLAEGTSLHDGPVPLYLMEEIARKDLVCL